MKYELRTLYRTLLWLMGTVLLLAVTVRLAGIWVEKALDSTEYPASAAIIVGEIIGICFALAAFALSISGVILCVKRFYQSLFTGEGYMTFSLPVTPTQLLFSKLLSSLVATLSCYGVLAAALFIAGNSDVLFGLYPFGSLSSLGEYFAAQPLYAVESVLLLLGQIPASLLFFFLMASIGQLFSKGRAGITIGLSLACAFVFSLLFGTLLPAATVWEVSEHVLMWIWIAVTYGFCIGSFFVIRYLLMHKVNLIV